ncbi:UNVERIFIED_CONTAM: hypothetical protein PYX00_011288 [Menopon gallinae]|uniref:SRP54-type proteins GTP-binding domain-containing protein n=1 Tax=Menopon gallinae TaxID=328185 RepID=A0AAW2H762_9NEOP
MLECFLVFDTRGVVFHEEGTRPSFANSYIEHICIDTFRGKDRVQDLFVFYEARGPLIHLAFSRRNNEECLTDAIHRYESKDRGHVEAEVRNEEERDVLDYSTSVMQSREEVDVRVSKIVPRRSFRVFSNKIHIGDIYEKVKTHLISKNVEPDVASMFCDAIRPEFHNEWVCEGEFKEKMRAILGRAGAVEQLRVHVQRFRAAKHNVGFYEKGYNKDDAVVCRNAVSTAKSEGYDVVLVDTAGRMHNKRNLMQSLTKLVRYNVPDHIVFVGEALVGGDSLDHLKEFNRAVGEGTDRRVDSILLTKVDTVDDKIGQIVNMAVSAHAPVIFLGTGQSNVDLAEIDSDTMASIIMS